MNNYKELIKKQTELLVNCEEDYKVMWDCTHELYRIFSEISGVYIDNLNADKDIMLPAGKAISTAAAAHCLLEIKRTTVFLKGIEKAIGQKIKEKGSIRILYAGTGPYGTLVIPLLLLHKAENVVVDLIDINLESLEALKKIIDALDLTDFIENVYCQDATCFICRKKYDIVISETMQSGLKNEPQVAIMQKIVPQMDDEAIFIPEEISIDAALCNPGMEMDKLLSGVEAKPIQRINLGNIFKVNKQNLKTELMQRTIEIDKNCTEFPELKLYTTVKVFDNEILGENQSSITMPIRIYDFKRDEVATKIKIWYTQGDYPKIESEAVKQHEMVL